MEGLDGNAQVSASRAGGAHTHIFVQVKGFLHHWGGRLETGGGGHFFHNTTLPFAFTGSGSSTSHDAQRKVEVIKDALCGAIRAN